MKLLMIGTLTYGKIKMKIYTYTAKVAYQGYILPLVKITHNKVRSGYYEMILGWFNRELIIQFGKKLK